MVHVENGRILVPRNRFNLRATIECGQVFRYARLDSFPGTGGSGAAYELVSTDKTCLAVEEGRETVIYTRKKDIPYFIRYFDLERSYEPILRELRERTGDRSLLSPASAAFVEAALDYGRGLHILRQDPFETLLSFIISTNNNIKRIQAIIERICTSLGKPCPGPGRFLYAFPKAGEAADKSEELFRTLGCGYRAPWIAAAAERACDGCLDGLEKLPTQ
jgi:N-glycosylase/DNA lyase